MFKMNLDPELRARIEHDRRESRRLYALTDTWLAHAILALARQAQGNAPEHAIENGDTYNSRLIWGIVPELARRLGPVKLTTQEIDWEIRALNDHELRIRTGHTIGNIAFCVRPGWRMLTREPIHGNPLVMAVDRLAPGRLDDRDDPIMRRLVEIARNRGAPFDGIWMPAVDDFGQKHDFFGAAEHREGDEESDDADGGHFSDPAP